MLYDHGFVSFSIFELECAYFDGLLIIDVTLFQEGDLVLFLV